MKLTQEDLKYLSTVAKKAAINAGEIISDYTNRRVEVISKKSGESKASQVVTEVDFKSQKIIFKAINNTIEQFDLAVLSEENPDDGSRFEKDNFWCIDPMDGTLSFIESKNGYSVSIALVARDGTPLVGVIYDPLKEVLYSAIKGQGALRNGNLWNWNQKRNNYLTFIHDSSFSEFYDYENVVAKLKEIAQLEGLQGVKVIAKGGAALNACWVLENAPACYFKFPKVNEGGGSLWDYAASACIFNEAGGVASDYSLNPLDLNRRDSTYMNHCGILYVSDSRLAKKINMLLKDY